MTQAVDLSDDPRPTPGAPPADGAVFPRPMVAGAASRAGPWLAIAGAVLVGLVVLAFLIARRGAAHGDSEAATSLAPAISAPAPPPDLGLAEAEGRASNIAPTGPQAPALLAPTPVAAPVVSGPGIGAGSAQELEALQHRRAPSLVVDLGEGPATSTPAVPAAAVQASGAASGAGLKVGPSALNGDEQFAERVGGAEPDHAKATFLRNPHSVVPQGTMIPAVLETAMNSDLPGFVRAVVSRDVRGFDGSSVLIPRGSRLVGQYRSGLSQGASRILVIWTRLLRPDGASVQIASPGGDPLGRAGQEGKVHSHFLRQFADSILLSVINAELTNLAAQPSTQIVIGGVATGLSSSAAPLATTAGAAGTTGGTTTGATSTTPAFPPTITVMQGAPISIFVARDLDFSDAPAATR